jgi:hypothetical protein
VLGLQLTARPIGAQQALSDEDSGSPAGVTQAVIAQGMAPMPGAELAWRVVRDTAEPFGETVAQARALGFAFADDGPILLTDEGTGLQTRLGLFEAAFTPDGASQRRESLDDDARTYVRIALVPAESATDPGGDELLYAGDPFAAPGGNRDLDLVKGNLYDGTDGIGAAGESPVLIYVAEGEIEATADDGTNVTLATGEAAALAGPVQLRSNQTTGNGSTYIAAVIGEAVPAAGDQQVVVDQPGGGDAGQDAVGRIIVLTEFCPPGISAAEAADTAQGDPCFGGDPVTSMSVVATNLTTGDFFTVGADANGTVALSDIPAGDYELVIDAGPPFGETVGDCGGQDQSAGLPVVSVAGSIASLSLPAGKEYLCVTRTVQPAGEIESPSTGSLTAIFYACPDGMTLDTLDPSQCSPLSGNFNAGFEGGPEALSNFTADFDGVAFTWSGLPVDDGVLYSLAVWDFPAGYASYAFSSDGGPVMLPAAGGYVLTADQPSHTVEVFFFSA